MTAKIPKNLYFYANLCEFFLHLKQEKKLTFFMRTTPMAVWALKQMAFIIISTPTAVLLLKAARLTIQPLMGKEGEDVMMCLTTKPGLRHKL